MLPWLMPPIFSPSSFTASSLVPSPLPAHTSTPPAPPAPRTTHTLPGGSPQPTAHAWRSGWRGGCRPTRRPAGRVGCSTAGTLPMLPPCLACCTPLHCAPVPPLPTRHDSTSSQQPACMCALSVLVRALVLPAGCRYDCCWSVIVKSCSASWPRRTHNSASRRHGCQTLSRRLLALPSAWLWSRAGTCAARLLATLPLSPSFQPTPSRLRLFLAAI